MKFQGDIASIAITDVAQNLAANLKSGFLTIRRGEESRQLVLRQGKIVSYSDNLGFSIPDWLEEKGLVEEEIFRKALRRYRKAKKKSLGEILEELDGMDLEVYLAHVKDVVLETIFETFSFREGTFEFEEREPDPEALDREIVAAGLEVPVNSVMMEAARRMDDWEAIRRSLPSENDIYQIASSDLRGLLEELSDSPAALATIELLDGTRSIREVIAASPAARFDTSRLIASLVSRKLARPVDGDELVKQLDRAGSSSEGSRALVRLKAALEREPGNQSLLQKVAELSLAAGKPEESAIYYKLLAQALSESGKEEEAVRELRRSLELNRRDIGTWQKLIELLENGGNRKELLAAGREMVACLREMGLNELARDQLVRLIKTFPALVDLRLEHADTLFALGDRAEAVKRLLDLARDLFQSGKRDDAETTLARVIEYDPNHRRAREIYDKVRTGKLERQRQRRRLLIRAAAACAATAVLGFFLGYDLYVRREFSRATSEIFAEGLSTSQDYEHARQRLEAIERGHPLSLLRFFEGREILEAIRETERRRFGARAPDDRPPDPLSEKFPIPPKGILPPTRGDR